MIEHFPGYPSLVGPESLSIPSHELYVRTVDDYNMWHLLIVTAKKGKVWITHRRREAYINHGRWVIDCAWCQKGVLTRPDWGVANCIECGARYPAGTIAFPDDPSIQHLLLLRPVVETQNWDNKQTAADLLKENEELSL
jgi:hypothetical protein